jgi:exonuclease SbcD
MAEASYPHQVCIVDLRGPVVRDVRVLAVPRSVEMRRIPAQGAAPIDDVLREIAALPNGASLPDERHPFTEVVVATSGPEPALVERIGEAIAGKAAFLVKVTREAVQRPDSTGPAPVVRRTFTPEEVFVQRWVREHATPPPSEFLGAFHQLVDAANQEAG